MAGMFRLSAILLLVATMSLFGTNATAQQPKAKITFEVEGIDLGTIKKGANGTVKFIFLNTGTAPLIIASVKTSCSCLKVTASTKVPVPPGATGTLVARYDTNRVGHFNKSITIISNAVNRLERVQIRGNVEDK